MLKKKMPINITIEPPPECRACKWKPVKQNNEKQEIAVENSWIYVNIPNSVVQLFFCPKCGFVMPQDNLIECVQDLNKAKSRKILEYGGPRVLPPKGSVKLN